MINAVYFKKKKTTYEGKISEKRALNLVKSKEHCWIDVVNATKEELNKILKTIFPK